MIAALPESPPVIEPEERNPDSLYEVIDGVEVELPPMSFKSTALAKTLYDRLLLATNESELGTVYFELMIRLRMKARVRDRRPDLVFASYAKWPKGKNPTDDSAWDIVPDLCVEVVSPSDKINELERKIDEYFAVGVPLVWVVLPDLRRVKVYRSSFDITILTDRDALAAEDILPGFRLPLAQYFDL